MLYLTDGHTIVGEHGQVLNVELDHQGGFVVVFTGGGIGSVVKEYSTREDARVYITSVCVLLRQNGNVVLTKE